MSLTTDKPRFYIHGVYEGCNGDHADVGETCDRCIDGIYCEGCGEELLEGAERVVARPMQLGERRCQHICPACASDVLGWPPKVDALEFAHALAEYTLRRPLRLRAEDVRRAPRWAEGLNRSHDYKQLRKLVRRLRELKADAAKRAKADARAYECPEIRLGLAIGDALASIGSSIVSRAKGGAL